MGKSMEKENFYGKMIVCMKDNFFRTIFMVLENIFGKMVEFMKDNGRTIKCKEKECLYG